MKKIIALALALMMILSLSVTAFADEAQVGSITINGASAVNVYSIYRLLDLESYDKTSGAYSYKVNSDWATFFASDTVKTKYFTVDEANYATWIGGDSDTAKEQFAKDALAHAKANDIDPIKSSANVGDAVLTETTLKFSDLYLGYYLVDSTMGALCGLTTTNPDASINAKNGIPTIDKQVKEDSTDQWGASATMDIGQIVEYRVTVNVHAGAENYVLHDNMDAGLEFDKVTKIEHVVPGSDTHAVETDLYTVVSTGLTDNCDFEIRFSKEFCDELETNDKIIIYYQAMLMRNALIAKNPEDTSTEKDTNDNTAYLTFGEEGGNHKSNEDTTSVKTFYIDIIKTDSQNILIDGAEFRIYDAATGGNEVKVALTDDGKEYRRARADEPGVAIVVTDGKMKVRGLDNGTYYLEEVVSPEGYNKLTTRQRFIISDDNLDAIFNDGIYSTGSGVHVVNKTGTMLPETGGIGTTLFVTIGAMMVMAAGVLLVTKKRMSMIED